MYMLALSAPQAWQGMLQKRMYICYGCCLHRISYFSLLNLILWRFAWQQVRRMVTNLTPQFFTALL